MPKIANCPDLVRYLSHLICVAYDNVSYIVIMMTGVNSLCIIVNSENVEILTLLGVLQLFPRTAN